MDSKLYIHRAENEIKLAEIIFVVSEKTDIQKETFKVNEPETYFSAVIAHSYYSIFYGAKAYLLKKGIEISAPEEHKKTFEEFKKFVESGELDVELLRIYQEALVRAEYLLGIFKKEKGKRGEFTYRTIPQANKEPAKESIEHAKTFFRNMNILCKDEMEQKICQSCGMPLRNIRDFGTNNDGNKNNEYCFHCFQNGRFLDEEINLKDKIEKNVKFGKMMGMSEEEARKMASAILPKLKRWKK